MDCGGCSEQGGHNCHQLSSYLWSLQLWVEERLPLAQSADYGINLQTVQLFMKKNQVSTALPCQCHLPLLQKASDSRLSLLLVALGSPDPLTEQLG